MEEKNFEIKSSKIVDLYLHYSYTIKDGVNQGDLVNRKGANPIHEDLSKAFSTLDVFLAHIDEAYHWADNQTPIEELDQDIVTEGYAVTGFKLVGSEENQSVILIGTKNTTYGVIDIVTPKIKLENSIYLYVKPLEERLNSVITEVELYHNGKIAPKYEQQEMKFGIEEEDFENAKVK